MTTIITGPDGSPIAVPPDMEPLRGRWRVTDPEGRVVAEGEGIVLRAVAGVGKATEEGEASA